MYNVDDESFTEFLASEVMMNVGGVSMLEETCEVSVNGVLFWKSRCRDVSGVVLFDLRKNVFERVKMPGSRDLDIMGCRFVEFGRCAAVVGFTGDKGRVGLWRMEDDGVIGDCGNWKKLMTYNAVPSEFLLLGYLGSGEIVALDEWGLLLYETESKRSRHLGLSDKKVIRAFEYTESLVSLRGFIDAGQDAANREEECEFDVALDLTTMLPRFIKRN